MAKKYQVRPEYLNKYPDAVTLVTRNGSKVAVALCGKDIQVDIGARRSGPPSTKTVKGATQEELKYLFENEKHPFVEEVEEGVKP